MDNKKKIIITSGYFNPLHIGHVRLLKEAKSRGDFLVVIVNSDAQAKVKGAVQFMPQEERMEIIKSIKYADHVMLSVDVSKSVAESLKVVANQFEGQLFFAKGGDRNADNIPEDEKKVCQDFNIQIISGVGGNKIQSSSWLIQKVVNAFFSVKPLKSSMKEFSSIEVLGNRIDMVQIPDVIGLMDFWITQEEGKCHWIVATGMHGVVESQKNKEFKNILNSADIFAPDGISLVWLARLNGFHLKRRVAGPDLFSEFLKFSNQKGYKNYFYGDTQETLSKLQNKLSKELPGVRTEYFSPPFRELTKEEDKQIVQNINAAKPDVLWVGLGLPKQEKWIFEHINKLQVPVIVGVGAAFKFYTGTVKRAPEWIGNAGFEWLWRLFAEPKRVWRRVFIDAPYFIWLVSADLIRNKFK